MQNSLANSVTKKKGIEFKLFAGVTPETAETAETAELFGEMMGLDATGDKAADDAFQEYLRRTKNSRSTMKRLMHRIMSFKCAYVFKATFVSYFS